MVEMAPSSQPWRMGLAQALSAAAQSCESRASSRGRGRYPWLKPELLLDELPVTPHLITLMETLTQSLPVSQGKENPNWLCTTSSLKLGAGGVGRAL